MSFVGKFDAKSPTDDLGAHLDSNARAYVETVKGGHAPADAIIVPDAHLLFNGDFKRSGVDLVLSGDGHELVLHDYFKGEKHAALASPDGAHLTGDIVNALSGHVQYAQADGSASAATIIGHVTKLSGTATAIRNGVSVALNPGDNVEKGDVVQSGPNSTVGISFIDGTVFGLSSNARMVLNEMIYDPNGSNNSSLLSLVSGAISFVAGETAKHGDMKVDTPVATMGIRGTAVLVEIDFNVPGQGSVPDAKFQVLVEPDGTTGSYVLLDKSTLEAIAIVNKAGQVLSFSNGSMSVSNSPLSADLQKLIIDVFNMKFSDNSNTKTFDHFTDSVVPVSLTPVYAASGITATPVVLIVTNTTGPSGPPPTGTPGIQHVPIAPSITTFNSSLSELVGVTNSPAIDTISGKVNFADLNAGDLPTVSTSFTSFTYQDAHGHAISPSLLQMTDIAAVEAALVVVQTPGNNNVGSATWTYNIVDGALDFLAQGEILTLTYTAKVDSNYAPDDLTNTQTFTITITGTNDAPVITTGPESVAYAGGKFTPGGNLQTVGNVPTTGTLVFTDVDLTDTHTVATKLADATLSGSGVPTLDMAQLEVLAPTPMAAFEQALSAIVAADSTGTGTGTINWTLADLPVYLADFIPTGEVLTLTYTVTVTDEHGATSTQDVTVTITGTDAAAVVWIATTGSGSTGDWNDPLNWETGTVPTAASDVIIITDQLIGKTPYYPVTINGLAYANSLTMNDYGTLFTNSPTLINNSTLTVGAGGINLSADSIIDNYGTIVVGGQMEVLQQSSLHNYGQLTLQDGGDFQDQSTVANFALGNIEVSGGTLNILVDVANSGQITVDSTAKLTLNGGAITGGTLSSLGTIEITGTGSIDNDIFGNTQLTVDANQTLTLDGTTITGGIITDDGTIKVDSTETLKLSGVALTGGAINNLGTVEVTGTGSIDNDSFGNVQLTIDASGMLTLDGTTITGGAITNHGTVNVDGIKTLNLVGVALTGGTITNGGTIDSTGTSSISNAVITNSGTIEATSGVLTIDPAVVVTLTNSGTLEANGGELDITTEPVNNSGTLQAINDSTLKLTTTTVTNTGDGTITVGLGSTLDLVTAIITGGTLGGAGAITTAAGNTSSTLSGVTVNSGTTVTSAVGTLVLTGTIADNGEIDAATGVLDLVNAIVTGGTLGGTDTITTAAGNTSSTLSGVTVNSGTTVTSAVGTLELTGIITDNGEIDATTGVLDLVNATIDGGKLVGSGTITTASGNTESTLGGVTVNSGTTVTSAVGSLELTGIITDNGEIDATTGALDLVNATVDGGKLGGSGTITTTTGNTNSTLNGVTVNTGTTVTSAVGTLELSGTIADNGEIDATTGVLDLINAIIDGGTLGGTGTITTATGNTSSTLSGVTVNSGTSVTSAVGTLELTGIITDNGEIDATTGVLDLINAIIDGGKLGGTGTITTATGNTSSTLSGVTVNSGTNVTSAVGTLELTGMIADNGEIDATTGVLDLVNAIVTGGALGGTGTITTATGNTDSTLSSVTIVNGITVTSAVGALELTGTIANSGQFDATTTGVLDLVNAIITGGTLSGAGTIMTGTGNTDSTLSGVTIASGTTVTSAVGALELTGTIGNSGEFDATTGVLDLVNAIINGGTLGGAGTIMTGTGNTDSTLSNVTIASGAIVTASVGALELTGTIGNSGEFDATTGELDLLNATVNGGALDGVGTITTAIGNTDSTLSNVTIASGAIVTASVGTLELTGTIANSGQFDTTTGTLDFLNATVNGGTVVDGSTIDVTGDSTIDGNLSLSGGLVRIEDNVTLTLGDALAIGANTVTLVGANAILDDSAGLSLAGGTIGGLGSLAADTNLSGYGTVSIPLDVADQVSASGGMLEFSKAVDSTVATSFDIATATNSVLKFDAAVGTFSTNPMVTFEGGNNGTGVLDLTAISLSNFHGVIANFGEGEAIDVHNAASASLDNTGQILTVFDSSGASLGTIDFATSYAGDIFDVSNSGAITVDDLAGMAPLITSTSESASSGLGVNLVTNGGFESGDFSGWTLSGNTGFTLVASSDSHSGTYDAWLGPVGSDGHLTQNILTVAGEHYTLDFWLANDGGVPNDFSVSWNGTTLSPEIVNLGSQSYTEYQYDVVAAGSSSALEFTFQQNPAYFHLDDISVTSDDVADGTIGFTGSNDVETASFTPLGQGDIGTFSLGAVHDVNGIGSVDWQFSATSSELQQLLNPVAGHSITQTYDVAIGDGNSAGTVLQEVGLTFGSSGNDTFVFAPGMGQEVLFNFSQQAGNTDHIELDHFGVSNFSQLVLQSVNNNHDTLINLGHNDSLLVVGVSAVNLHANDFVLHP